MSPARVLTAAGILSLAALPWVWHAWLAPPRVAPGWAMALVFMLPVLPALVLLLARHPRAGFWGAVAALFYFSHGVMEAWSAPAVRGLALAEAVIAAGLVLASSWDGLRGRFAGRRRGPAV